MSNEVELMSELVAHMDVPSVSGKCPDGGACHHGCDEKCFRVKCCLPLSGYGEDWTEEVKEKHK